MIFRRREKKRKKNKQESFGRLNFVVAIIFLLVMILVLKLYSLQLVNHDLYIALAENQHKIYKELEPERGRIFVHDGVNMDIEKVYPIAVNKEFASVFAVPKKVKKAKEISEFLFEIFDKEDIEKEVDELLDEDPFFASSTEEIEEEKLEEFRKIKKDLEVENRKKEITEKYFKKLSKKNDPYEPIVQKVDEEKLSLLNNIKYEGIEHIMDVHRYYPDNNIGAHLIGFLGFQEDKKVGLYGLEGFFNDELSGVCGSIISERSADGKTIIVNDREFNAAVDGADLFLTINRSIQFEACQKLKEAVESHEADGGSVVVVDPFTGAVVAMCSYYDYNPNDYGNVEDANIYNNPVIFDAYEPGSIFKSITLAIGLDSGKIKPDTIYNDKGFIKFKGWDKPIKNSDFASHGGYGWVDMATVLEQSLNTGSIFVMQEVGDRAFSDYVMKFGFGEKTGIELETEGYTNIDNLKRKRLRPVEMATASFGQGITATPLQMVISYAAIANGGILMKPYIVSDIIFANGERQKTKPKQIRRVISERTSLLTSAMMVKVVDGGHARLAGVDGYFVAGKTGTAQVASEKGGYSDKTIHTFVGFAPVDEPKFVMLVKLDDPKDAYYAATSAAPLFGKIAKFILDYYQIPKER
ncbi:penicillin-binding protein 2 [Candidatus Parcubacteria bacterium]|nr:penicillin-binding protein 2 [Candidatus Parcubacteria bacterium]